MTKPRRAASTQAAHPPGLHCSPPPVPMQIWIDADACPAVIKGHRLPCRRTPAISTTLVANRMLRTPPSRFIRAIQVPAGFDVADRHIVDQVGPGDLVITADIPLAAAVLERQAHALNPRARCIRPPTSPSACRCGIFWRSCGERRADRGAGRLQRGRPAGLRRRAGPLSGPPLRLSRRRTNWADAGRAQPSSMPSSSIWMVGWMWETLREARPARRRASPGWPAASQVRGEGHVGGAEAPRGGHAIDDPGWASSQACTSTRSMPSRDAVEGQVQRLAEQAPGAEHDHHPDHQAHQRVEPAQPNCR